MNELTDMTAAIPMKHCDKNIQPTEPSQAEFTVAVF